MNRLAYRAFDRLARGPLTADLRDLIEGPSHTFFIEWPTHMSDYEIQRLLNGHGVASWGHMAPLGTDELMLTVRRKQARWAQYLLERAGLPIVPQSAFCTSSGIGGASAPTSPATFWRRLMHEVSGAMDKILGG